MAYDVAPLATIEEKEAIVGRAADEGWTVVFEHDPEIASARIERTAKGFAAVDTSEGLPAGV